MNNNLTLKIDGFSQMQKTVERLFGKNLLAIFIHGSLFDGTFDKYSDYDIVIITKKLPDSVINRDIFAQRLKSKLLSVWKKNPFSFDFVTQEELLESAQNGHPFVRSILKKGSPIYDPKDLFYLAKNNLKDKLSVSIKSQMIKNLIFLSKKHYKAAKYLQESVNFQYLSLVEVSKAITLLMRAKLIQKNKNIYKGEIYQFFLKEYEDKIDFQTTKMIWNYAFHANQISCRFIEPHVDIPLQVVEKNFKKILKIDYTQNLLKIYEKISYL